jgi:hypothetical protein
MPLIKWSMSKFKIVIFQDELLDQKRLLVFKADKLEKIVNLVKNSFPIS